MTPSGCPLCDADGGALIYRNDLFRVVRADESGFPAFYRLVWNAHVVEFSDLTREERHLCMDAVVLIEQSLRDQLQPVKVNVASFGNMVPHLHWHVIARFEWDSHFPAPVWAAAQRENVSSCIDAVIAQRLLLERLMAERLRAAV